MKYLFLLFLIMLSMLIMLIVVMSGYAHADSTVNGGKAEICMDSLPPLITVEDAEQVVHLMNGSYKLKYELISLLVEEYNDKTTGNDRKKEILKDICSFEDGKEILKIIRDK